MFRNKALFRLVIPAVAVASTSIVSTKSLSSPPESTTKNLNIRGHEIATLLKKLRKGGLIVLTGPKQIGKSTLSRQLLSKNKNIFYIDLKGKDRKDELDKHVMNQMTEFESLNQTTIRAKLDMYGVSGEYENKSDNSGIKSSAKSSRRRSSILLAVEALVESEKKKGSPRVDYPTAVVIDEAQTLMMLDQADVAEFLKYIAAVTRDGDLALLLVTSDYESLMLLTGADCVIIYL